MTSPSQKMPRRRWLNISAVILLLMAASFVTIYFIGPWLVSWDRSRDGTTPGALSAQSTLRNALAAAKTCHANEESYERCTLQQLSEIETSLTFLGPNESPEPDQGVSMFTSDDVFAAAVVTPDGLCWMIRDDARAGTTYGKTTTKQGGCNGSYATLNATEEYW